MECPNCGSQVWSSAESCHECGAQLGQESDIDGTQSDGATQSDVKESGTTDESGPSETAESVEQDRPAGGHVRQSADDSTTSASGGVSWLLVVGVLVGLVSLAAVAFAAPMILDSGDDSPTNQASLGAESADSEDRASGTPTATAELAPTGDAVASATPKATESPTHTPRQTPTPTLTAEANEADISINRAKLEREIADEINEYRQELGLTTLAISGITVDAITEMSRNHTGQLRQDGQAWAIPTDYDIAGLYSSHDLYRTCAFRGNGDYIVRPDDGNLLAVQRLDVGSESEQQLARQIMNNWADSQWHSEKFEYENAERVGVGVTLDTETESVYVAMSMC